MRPIRAIVAFSILAASPGMASRAAEVEVATPQALASAIAAAQPGTRIVLLPGLYPVAGNLNCVASGTPAQPIEVVAKNALAATVVFSPAGAGAVVEGFRVAGAHWHFSGLDIQGSCAQHVDCEHAFHLAGDADGTVIRNNRLRDFNAQIKSNGSNGLFPDDVLVEGNEFFDSAPRATDNPVTKVDVVGGRRWRVRGNTLRDFAKGGGDTVSYGAFLKGGSREGVFERNLVVCSRDHAGGVRIGLSLGGGGTAPASVCEQSSCDPEHIDGILRNNLILNCSDVGVYVNRGANTRIFLNTLYATSGIDLRFPTSSGEVRNNLVGGQVRNRDGATGVFANNLSQIANATFQLWFEAPQSADFRLRDGTSLVGQGVATVPPTLDDFCGNARVDGAPDLGALEYSPGYACFTTTGGGFGARVFADGFEAPAG
jgi:hypothetical protein